MTSRHVDVIGAEAADGIVGTERNGVRKRVQQQLAVGKMNPLGVPGGARGVESRRFGVLIQIRKIIAFRGVLQKRPLFARQRQVGFELGAVFFFWGFDPQRIMAQAARWVFPMGASGGKPADPRNPN